MTDTDLRSPKRLAWAIRRIVLEEEAAQRATTVAVTVKDRVIVVAYDGAESGPATAIPSVNDVRNDFIELDRLLHMSETTLEFIGNLELNMSTIGLLLKLNRSTVEPALSRALE